MNTLYQTLNTNSIELEKLTDTNIDNLFDTSILEHVNLTNLVEYEEYDESDIVDSNLFINYIDTNLYNMHTIPKNVSVSTMSLACNLGTIIKTENIYKYMILEDDNIVAIKEASGNLEQAAQIRRLSGNSLDIYAGDDALTLPFMSVGATGVISVISNIIPEVMLNITESFNKRYISDSNIIFYKYYKLMKLAFCDSNPVPIKYMLSLKNYNECLSLVRMPLVQLSDDNKNKITTELQCLLLI
jgi:hypothetical protein